MTSANPFWTYSWSVYHEPGVREACLALQEREGIDVNLLLFCCWAGRNGHTLDASQIDMLRDATAAWQRELVLPLRRARTWLKSLEGLPEPPPQPDAATLRRSVKDAELESERIEQTILYNALPLAAGEPDMSAVVGNIHAYFALLGRTPGPEDTADLVAIVLAALPRAMRALDLVREFEDVGAGSGSG